jgi:uncharacterized protein YbjT (DUF2867 family)
MARAVIIGGAGFVGSHLCDRLLSGVEDGLAGTIEWAVGAWQHAGAVPTVS